MVDYKKFDNLEVSSDDEHDEEDFLDTIRVIEEQKNNYKEKKLVYNKLVQDAAELSKNTLVETEVLKKAQKSVESAGAEIQRLLNNFTKFLRTTPIKLLNLVMSLSEKSNYISNDNLQSPPFLERVTNYIKKNEHILRSFSLLSDINESKRFLKIHTNLIDEEAVDALFIAILNILHETKDKNFLYQVLQQCICLYHVVHIMALIDGEPKTCVDIFYEKFTTEKHMTQTVIQNEFQAMLYFTKIYTEEQIQCLLNNCRPAVLKLRPKTEKSNTYQTNTGTTKGSVDYKMSTMVNLFTKMSCKTNDSTNATVVGAVAVKSVSTAVGIPFEEVDQATHERSDHNIVADKLKAPKSQNVANVSDAATIDSLEQLQLAKVAAKQLPTAVTDEATLAKANKKQ